MLETLSKHSGINIELKCFGDLNVDGHHTVEDCGIVIGILLNQLIFPIKEVERFGEATIVMDEASTTTNIDLSNRIYLHYDVNVFGNINDFEVELVEEFFNAIVNNFKINCHIINNYGRNKHHIIESVFKSFAISLRRAMKFNIDNNIPSTKGIL